VAKSKQQLRIEMLELRESLDSKELASAGLQIAETLANWEVWKKARMVLVFAASPKEPLLDTVIKAGILSGKTTFFPFIQSIKIGRVTGLSQLIKVKDGYRQPASAVIKPDWPEFDLVIMPGLAFDAKGNRLGQGSGWYDRFFGEYLKIYSKPKTIVAGVCLEKQIIEAVTVDKHDIPCHYLLTESGIKKNF